MVPTKSYFQEITTTPHKTSEGKRCMKSAKRISQPVYSEKTSRANKDKNKTNAMLKILGNQ